MDPADCHCSICVITLVRIKVTSEINRKNGQVQSAMIALLTCLEALLGVVNACLPVMKPVFNKIAFFASFSPWTARWTLGEHSQGSRTPRSVHSSLGRSRNRPKISQPRRIAHRPSLLMFSNESATSSQSPALFVPPYRPLSMFRFPRASWSALKIDLEKADGTNGRKDEDVYSCSTGEQLPTRPLRSFRSEVDSALKSLEDQLHIHPALRFKRDPR